MKFLAHVIVRNMNDRNKETKFLLIYINQKNSRNVLTCLYFKIKSYGVLTKELPICMAVACNKFADKVL